MIFRSEVKMNAKKKNFVVLCFYRLHNNIRLASRVNNTAHAINANYVIVSTSTNVETTKMPDHCRGPIFNKFNFSLLKS